MKDPNVFKSLDILQKKLKMKRKSKSVDGLIKFLVHLPLHIRLWTQQNIELFYELGSVHSLVADATSNTTVQLSKKRIFFLLLLFITGQSKQSLFQYWKY